MDYNSNREMSNKSKAQRRNPRKSAESVFDRDSELRRLPASAVDLSDQERRFLKDPNWIDEDESDALLAMRCIEEEEGQAILFEDVLDEFGYGLQH